MRRARTAAAIATGLILAAGSVTLADDDPAAPLADAAGPGRTPVAAVPPEQAAHFGVLRRPAQTGDVPPYHGRRVIRIGAGPEFGANPALARRASANAGPDVFLVPADGHLCIVTGNGGGGCNRVEAALDGNLLLVENRGGGAARVHAALPDGVRRVVVDTAGGGEASATVENNVATIDTEGRLEGLRFEDADGVTHRVPLWSPPQ